MLFESTPVNASLSAVLSATDVPNTTTGRRLFVHGANMFWVLRNLDDSVVTVLKSADSGASWAEQDTGFTVPSGNFFLCADAMGDTLYFVVSPDGFTFYLVKFDMLSSTYLYASNPLTPSEAGLVFQTNAAGVAASNGDFHLAVTFSTTADSTAGPFVYYTESSGSWSAYTLLDPDYVFPTVLLLGGRDSAGDIHWWYEAFADAVGSYPHQLRHIKEGGSPSVIQTVSVLSAQAYKIFNAIVFDGKFYISNTRDGTTPTVWVSDSDTNPTTWIETVIDVTSGSTDPPGIGTFAIDVTNSLLHLLYALPRGGEVDLIRISTLTAGVWSAPGLAHNPATNPVADALSRLANGPDAVFIGGQLALGVGYFVGFAFNAVFLSGAGSTAFPSSGRVLNFCF